MVDDQRLWLTDPATLRDYLPDAMAARENLEACPAPERLWLMALLGREEQALEEGVALLKGSTDRLELLLVLAKILQRQYRWREAARLQEQALRLAGSRVREATVRHHLGLRLFDEALYRDAAAEFQWASDLFRVTGNTEAAAETRRAMQRALHLAFIQHNYFHP
jgi:tetratricopeptide (TPR) repeat protein